MKTRRIGFESFDMNEEQIIRNNAQKIYDLFKMLGNGEFDICYYEESNGDAFEKLETVLPFLKNEDIKDLFNNFECEDREDFFLEIDTIVEHSDVDKHKPIKLEDWYACGKTKEDLADYFEYNSSSEDYFNFLEKENMLEKYLNYIYQK